MAMVLNPFNGNLNSNEIYSVIYNMIISQTVFASPIKGTYSLADKFRKDGGLYGDTKLFYSVQIGKVEDWGNDSEASNLLALQRPTAPNCQAVTIDVFKKIWLTVDNFLSKRAWGDESAFSQFNSVVLATMRDTKRVYEATMMNVFIGTEETSTGKQTKTITVTTGTASLASDKEAAARIEAQEIAKGIADLMIDVCDINKDYNDLQYLRSYDEGELMFVVNADWYNKLTKLDLPTIFHKDGLMDKLGENVIPGRYFGHTLTESNYSDYSASTPSAGKPIDSDDGKYTPGNANANGKVCFAKDFTINNTYYRAGDEVPAATVVYDSTKAAGSKVVVPCYVVDANIVCKVCVAEAIQYMSAFETQTEFYNPRSLTQNHYLIFGHSDLSKSRLKEFPFITIKKA